MKDITEQNTNSQISKKAFTRSFYYPLVFLLLLWLVKLTEVYFNVSFAKFGIFPQSLSGLKGIIFSPLIHGDFSHLVSNSFPILILGAMLNYFYRNIAFKVFFIGWFILGFWLWIIGRESYHIGASGLIYCVASFLFVSGILRKHAGLMSVSLVVTFLYGGIIWGIFPLMDKMSWEGHLSGLVAGIVLALFFRKKGPQRKKYSWELEEEEFEDFEFDSEEGLKNASGNNEKTNVINYDYKEKND